MKTNNFDERQLWARGNAFKHGFILFGIFIALDSLYAAFTQDSSHLFGAMTGAVMIACACMTTSIELIRNKAYEWNPGNNKIAIIIIAACSFVSFLHRIDVFLKNGMNLSTLEGRENLGLSIAMLFLIILSLYYLYDVMKHKNKEEEESE